MTELDEIIAEKAKQMVEAETEKKPSALDEFNKKMEFEIDLTKSLEEQAKEFVGVRATENAIRDEDLTKDVTDRKKAEILNHADAHLKKEEAENKKADILLQEANYGVYDGVATYAGIKKPLPQKMQSILFAILSAVQTIVLIALGVPISIINILADGIDSVVKKLGTLTKSARWIVLAAIFFGLVWMGILIVKYFLAKFGIIA